MIEEIAIRQSLAGDDLPPLDYDQLDAGLGKDPELLIELIPIFLEDAKLWLDRADVAIRTGNAREIRAVGHLLGGTASAFAASDVTALARRLERMGANELVAGADEILIALESGVARLRPLLEAYGVRCNRGM